MPSKALNTHRKPGSVAKRQPEGGALPSVEAATLRLNGSKGLVASCDPAAVAAFLDYDGPVLAGPQEYRKPA